MEVRLNNFGPSQTEQRLRGLHLRIGAKNSSSLRNPETVSAKNDGALVVQNVRFGAVQKSPRRATMPSKSSGRAPAPGLPSTVVSRINHLSNLLNHLPESLPLDPPDEKSTYHFGIDEDDRKEEGLWFAFNRNLEVCFRTHNHPEIKFVERGQRLVSLVKLIKETMKNLPDKREFIQHAWLERLIKAAQSSGASVPRKR